MTDSRILGPVWCIHLMVLTVRGGSAVPDGILMCFSCFSSTIKDETSAAKFQYIKTVSGNVVEHSIAFRVVSIRW